MASLGTVNLPVRVVLEGAEELLDQVALLRTLEKMGARNRQLHAEVERLRKKNGELEKERVGLAGMNARWHLRVQELQREIENMDPEPCAAPDNTEDDCCGNGCCG